jgi:adenylate cyclase
LARGEITEALKLFDATLHLAKEHGFQLLSTLAIGLRGSALIASGQAAEGITCLGECLDAARAGGLRVTLAAYLAELATGYAILGRTDEGFAAVAEAMAFVESTGVRISEAYLHLIKGLLTLKRSDASNPKIKEEAESYFRQAIEVARRQGSKSLELSATRSLARLLRKTDRRDEARTMLAEIYNWFTEGFETADLKRAKALLDELSR